MTVWSKCKFSIQSWYPVKTTGDENREFHRLGDAVLMYLTILKNNFKRNIWRSVERIYILNSTLKEFAEPLLVLALNYNMVQDLVKCATFCNFFFYFCCTNIKCFLGTILIVNIIPPRSCCFCNFFFCP